MFGERIVEAVIGFITLIIFAIFFGYIVVKGKLAITGEKYYNLYAQFNDIDGISIGSVVKISGLNVGEVEDIFLNESFLAVAKIKIKQQYLVPADSSLSVATSGLIGSKYLMVSPGADDETMKQGDYFAKTQSSINLDGLIKNFAAK